MTVKNLIKNLKKCPQDANVIIRAESEIQDIGDIMFIDLYGDVCLFCDVDEKRYVKEYLTKKVTNS